MNASVFAMALTMGLLLIVTVLVIPTFSAVPAPDSAASPQDQTSDEASPPTSAPSPTEAGSQPAEIEPPTVEPPTVEPPTVAPPAAPLEAPDDPCLPPLYKDWQEMSLDNQEDTPNTGFIAFRIHIDRSNFELTFEGIHGDESAEEIYRTFVGLGDISSPTPEGRFLINHVYCYPDVVLFGASGERIPHVYGGFFAPILLCDRQGKCERFHELGLHGFTPGTDRQPQVTLANTYGAISAGCIRLPDPCKFKSTLIRLVGIGPLKHNDRGSYHWLNKPVEVVIDGDYPGTGEQLNLTSVIQDGLSQIRDGLQNVLDIFR
ncbi:MAG: hypothetical protein WBG50_10780 [Desulfomonilaceae bacterium]